MVLIRLRRVGSSHQARYRVIVADKESPRDGRFIEIIGQYNPRTSPGTIIFVEERVFYWLGVGAQPSESVQKLFKTVKLMERFERFQQGEDKANLLAEAESLYKTRVTDPKTSTSAKKL